MPSVTKFDFFFLFILNVPEDCSFTIYIAIFGSLYNFVNVFVFLATDGESSLTGLMFIFSTFTVTANVAHACARVFVKILLFLLKLLRDVCDNNLIVCLQCPVQSPRSNLLDPVVGK